MTDDLIGKQLANFRIDRVLGRGGMGLIYVGHDVKLDRPVAIKVIDGRYRQVPSYAERFVREARAIATWRHENIVQIYYADDTDNLYYFVMEYIDGVDLSKVLAQYTSTNSLLPHSAVMHIARSLASALDYAHKKGVIHRDIKPSNVMVAHDQRVVLMDFGLALDTQLGSQGEVFGTAHYIAPEQARRSADAIPQSDLYALGVMLYELLTGSVPFDDPSATSVALQHITQSPPPPQEKNPKLNNATAAVLLQALAKAPAERFQTGAEMIAALEQALGITGSHQLAANANAAPGVRPPSQPGALGFATFDPEKPLEGQYLDGYRVEALLGRGGMANIFRGVDVRLNRTVAIKVIDTPFRNDQSYAERFNREAQAIAQLEHPNIVRLYHYGDSYGLLYMVMEYIEGDNLHKVIEQVRTSAQEWTPRTLCRMIREVCAALDYAHSKGVIHRDVKPSNIMINKDGRAILADFGLALLTEVGTRGEIFGSPHYVAPEQAISSAKVVAQTDLYSLGVILYELWTGQVPFDDADPLAIAMLHMAEPPKAPRSINPAISAQLEAVILKMLAKDPAERFPSGLDLAEALEAALGISSTGTGEYVRSQITPVLDQAVNAPSTPAISNPTPPVVASEPKTPTTPTAPKTASQPIPNVIAAESVPTPPTPAPKYEKAPSEPTKRRVQPLPPTPAAVAKAPEPTSAPTMPMPPADNTIREAPAPRLYTNRQQRSNLLMMLIGGIILITFIVIIWQLMSMM